MQVRPRDSGDSKGTDVQALGHRQNLFLPLQSTTVFVISHHIDCRAEESCGFFSLKETTVLVIINKHCGAMQTCGFSRARKFRVQSVVRLFYVSLTSSTTCMCRVPLFRSTLLHFMFHVKHGVHVLSSILQDERDVHI